MKFDAIYFDGIHPVGEEITILVSKNGRTSFIGRNVNYSCLWDDIKVSGQLGQTARSLTLPNSAKCESFCHDQINALLDKNSQSRFPKILHKLESHWHYVAFATLFFIAFTWGMIVYGIPSLAKTVAFALPVSVNEQLSEGSLSIIDEYMLQPSNLDEKTKQRLTQKFLQITEDINDGHDYRLLFRSGIPANAFALPSGQIVVTDELIELSDNDDEVIAVLAHEVGHVVHEHGLRSVLQTSAIALIVIAVTGDIGSAGGFVIGMPTVLLETNYSRGFEREADDYALSYMLENNIDTAHFATILKKITGAEDEFT